MDRDKTKPLHNTDVDWDEWPVEEYLAETYRELHPSDAAIIDHHSAFYRQIPAGSLRQSVELGAGPNLYPLMLAASASRRIDALEKSSANVAYLRRQLRDGPDESWQPFYIRCRRRNPTLPVTLAEALARVHVIQGDALNVPPDTYDLASMHFLAEGVTADADEFELFCQTFIRSVRPGGYLVGAFMESMPNYRIGASERWPAYPVNVDALRRVFAPSTDRLTVSHIHVDAAVTHNFNSTGMVLLTARRRPS